MKRRSWPRGHLGQEYLKNCKARTRSGKRATVLRPGACAGERAVWPETGERVARQGANRVHNTCLLNERMI